MKYRVTTFTTITAFIVAGWAGLAWSQDDKAMSDQMMAQCQMMMKTEVSPRDPAALLSMKDKLQLTDEQVEQLQTLARQTREAAVNVLTDAQRQEVERLPAQPQSMMQMHQKMMGRMKEMRGDKGGMMCPMCSMMGMMQNKNGAAAQPAEKVEVTRQEQESVDQVTTSYLSIQQKLANDTVEGVADDLQQIREAAQELARSETAALVKQAEAVVKRANVEPAQIDTLKELREVDKHLSAAVIDLTRIASPSDQVAASLYVANCPMAEADWLQTSKEIVNPYMGKRMLRCGSVTQTLKAPADEQQ